MSKMILIKDYPDYATVIEGDIWSKHYHRLQNPNCKWRKLKPALDGNGYLIVTLCNKHGYRTKAVHRLIAANHVANPEGKPQVNHIDGCKTNNHGNNLEYCTNKENMQHAFRTGLIKPPNAKLWQAAAVRASSKAVQQFDINDNFIAEFKSQAEAARQTGSHQSQISLVCCGKQKTAQGYKWRIK